MAALSKIISVNNITSVNVGQKPEVVGTLKTATTSGTLAPAQTTTTMTATGKVTLGTLATRSGSSTPVKFSAAVGDGKGLKIDLKCQNCTIDFK